VKRSVLLLAAAVATVGCFDGDHPAAPDYDFSIEVFPLGIENLPQESFTILEATVTNETTGQVLADQAVAWTSDDPSIAAIDFIEDEEENLVPVVVGVAPGSTILRAKFQGAEAQIPIEVIADPVASGTLTAETTTGFVGEEIELEATFRNEDNVVVNRAIEFTSSDEDVAEVDENGVVTIVGAGTTIITAESEGVEATISITGALRPVASVVVSPDPVAIAVGGTQTFTARVLAANGEVLAGRTIAWSSGNTGVATVHATSGVATGVAPSGATAVLITATVEGVTGSARLFVDPAN
jgi:uncharacterized protein YjdB